MGTSNKNLKWEVLTVKRPGLTRDLPAGKENLAWVANSSTLISGEHDAVLIDTFLTAGQSEQLLDWVAASGKNLTAVYITHGHGDHFFGLVPILKEFPNAKALATPAVVAAMQAHLAPASVDGFWRRLFPGQIPDSLTAAQPLESDTFQLEGHDLVVIDAGHTDTAVSTCLYVPSAGLLVGGDVVYNGIHLYLGETDARTRQDWIETLDRLQELNPTAVVAGHKKPDNHDPPDIIRETSQYLRDFEELNRSASTAHELYEAMLERHPDRANPGSLWAASNAAKMQP